MTMKDVKRPRRLTMAFAAAGMLMLSAAGDEARAQCGAHDETVRHSGCVSAEEWTSPVTREARAERVTREPQAEPLWKLGRGLHNIAFGLPAELLRNPAIESLKADTLFGFGAGVLEGVVLGVGKGFWRMGAGFLDTVTFPAPMEPWYDAEYLPPYPF